MNKYQFPGRTEKPASPKVCVRNADDEIYIVQAVILFNNITAYGLVTTKESFHASFPNRNTITMREFGEWVREYYRR